MTKAEEQELKSQIETVLSQLRPYLQSDGGDVELVEITNDYIVKVRFTGACRECEMSEQTLKCGIESSIKKVVPKIVSVVEI